MFVGKFLLMQTTQKVWSVIKFISKTINEKKLLVYYFSEMRLMDFKKGEMQKVFYSASRSQQTKAMLVSSHSKGTNIWL